MNNKNEKQETTVKSESNEKGENLDDVSTGNENVSERQESSGAIDVAEIHAGDISKEDNESVSQTEDSARKIQPDKSDINVVKEEIKIEEESPLKSILKVRLFFI